MASKITLYREYSDDLITLRMLGIVDTASTVKEVFEVLITEKKYGDNLPKSIINTWLKDEAEIHFTDQRVTHRLKR